MPLGEKLSPSWFLLVPQGEKQRTKHRRGQRGGQRTALNEGGGWWSPCLGTEVPPFFLLPLVQVGILGAWTLLIPEWHHPGVPLRTARKPVQCPSVVLLLSSDLTVPECHIHGMAWLVLFLPLYRPGACSQAPPRTHGLSPMALGLRPQPNGDASTHDLT